MAIVETGKHCQYFINLDGSGRITLRNRQHIHKILVEPPMTSIINTQTVPLNNEQQFIKESERNSNNNGIKITHTIS